VNDRRILIGTVDSAMPAVHASVSLADPTGIVLSLGGEPSCPAFATVHTPSQARALAALLSVAADECERRLDRDARR
jgi:hypothetical protein